MYVISSLTYSHTHTHVCTRAHTQFCLNTCNCDSSNASSSQSVPDLPVNLTFQLGGLETDSEYCLQAAATYVVVQGFSDEPERRIGNGLIQRTEGIHQMHIHLYHHIYIYSHHDFTHGRGGLWSFPSLLLSFLPLVFNLIFQ